MSLALEDVLQNRYKCHSSARLRAGKRRQSAAACFTRECAFFIISGDGCVAKVNVCALMAKAFNYNNYVYDLK